MGLSPKWTDHLRQCLSGEFTLYEFWRDVVLRSGHMYFLRRQLLRQVPE
jgi:hypothetical protein